MDTELTIEKTVKDTHETASDTYETVKVILQV